MRGGGDGAVTENRREGQNSRIPPPATRWGGGRRLLSGTYRTPVARNLRLTDAQKNKPKKKKSAPVGPNLDLKSVPE